LVVVADDGDIFARVGEEAHELELEFVGVLEFVDHEVMEALLPFGLDVGVLVEEADGEEEEIVEVDGVECF